MGIDFNYKVQTVAADLFATSKRDEFGMEIHIYEPDDIGIKLSRDIYSVKCGQKQIRRFQIASEYINIEHEAFINIEEATCEACILVHFEDICTT